MDNIQTEQGIAAVRRFNRFYTKQIGVLNEGVVNSPYSLTQARVLYELAHRDRLTASDLARELSLDPGYLSRLLADFEKQGLIRKTPCAADGRQVELALTDAGRDAFAPLDRRSRDEVGAMLRDLTPDDRSRLIAAMQTVAQLLGGDARGPAGYYLRAHQPGDIGWLIQRHAALYAQEYGWDGSFEGLAAEVAGKFLSDFDPKREHCWIAERDGENLGGVFVINEGDGVARLRMLLVEPKARGLGIGKRLVNECIRFARRVGYKKMTLWTNDILVAARHIYIEAGFKLVAEDKHHSFGKDLVGQTWDLEL